MLSQMMNIFVGLGLGLAKLFSHGCCFFFFYEEKLSAEEQKLLEKL